jgi:hypothetical protein
LARQSLRWDAGYCALTGVAVLLFAAPLADHLDVAVGWVVAAQVTAFGVVQVAASLRRSRHV